MADQYYAAAESINCGAATALVVLDVVPSGTTRRLEINELAVSFNGSSPATPPIVRLVRTTGTPAGGGTITQAPVPLDSNAPASLATAYQPTTATPGVYTTAPTVGAQLGSWFVPNTGLLVVQYPLGLEATTPQVAGSGIGIQVLSPAAATVIAYLKWLE